MSGKLRLALLFVFLIALLVGARPSRASVLAGAIPLMVGEGIRFWAAGHLVKTRQLVTSGPYRYTRNPLYLGRLLILTGLCIMATLPYFANLALLLPGYAGFFGYYLRRKERVEPDRLREAHGEEYIRYREAVPALFPRWRAYRHAATVRWSSERMLRNREHLMVAGLLLVLVFLAWRAG